MKSGFAIREGMIVSYSCFLGIFESLESLSGVFYSISPNTPQFAAGKFHWIFDNNQDFYTLWPNRL